MLRKDHSQLGIDGSGLGTWEAEIGRIAVQTKSETPFTEKWMELEIIIVSEISQTQKAKCHTFSFILAT
jgi:hypothetical protein